MSKSNKSAGSPKRPSGRHSRSRPPARPTGKVLAVVFGCFVVVAALVALVVVLASPPSEPGGQPGVEVSSSIVVAGAPVPTSANAIGSAVPSVTGSALAGFGSSPLTVGPSGRPQVIIVGAHWCPHCNAELPQIVAFLGSGSAPPGVAVSMVSTAPKDNAVHFPPSRWLAEIGWPASDPVLADDEQGDAARAFGVTGFPTSLFVDAAGTVVARTVGEGQMGDWVADFQALAPRPPSGPSR